MSIGGPKTVNVCTITLQISKICGVFVFNAGHTGSSSLKKEIKMSNVAISKNHARILFQVFPAINKFLASVNARDILTSVNSRNIPASGPQRAELYTEVRAAFLDNGSQEHDLDGIWVSAYSYISDGSSFCIQRVSVGMEYNIDDARWQFSGSCMINPDGSLKLEHVNVHRHADAISFVIM